MFDGVVLFVIMFYGMWVSGMWIDDCEVNLLDGGVYFYDIYECVEGKWVLIGLIEL